MPKLLNPAFSHGDDDGPVIVYSAAVLLLVDDNLFIGVPAYFFLTGWWCYGAGGEMSSALVAVVLFAGWEKQEKE